MLLGSERLEAEGRQSNSDAGQTLAWILQASYHRDGSYSKTHEEERVTERDREKRIGAF